MECKKPFTLILDDPLSNVFIGHIDPAKGGPDPDIQKECVYVCRSKSCAFFCTCLVCHREVAHTVSCEMYRASITNAL